MTEEKAPRYTYISIVGTQLAAVFNPISILQKEGYLIDDVVLMGTEKTFPAAERLAALMKEMGYPIHEPPILVSDDDHENKSLLQAHEQLHRYFDRNLIFNAAGGQNFQIAQCTLEAVKARLSILFVYAEKTAIHLTRLQDGKFDDSGHVTSNQMPELLDPEMMLTLHEVPFENLGPKKNSTDLIIEKVGKDRVKIPAKAIKNIRIDNVDYDYIWNERNHPVFITSLITTSDSDKNQTLQAARDRVNSASGRDIIKDLYDKRYIVLTNNKLQLERMEGFRKIGTLIDINDYYSLDIDNPFQKALMAHGSDDLVAKIASIFEPTPGRPEAHLPQVPPETLLPHIIRDEPCKTVLYVVLGTNLLPTLLALYSCTQADEVVFIYTPGNQQVERFKSMIIENSEQLKNDLKNLKRISFHPAGIFGKEILSIKVEEGKKGIAVISPGTKSQGYFLTLLAGSLGGETYSIKTHGQKLVCLSNQRKKPKKLIGPDPATLLLLKGEDLVNPGDDATFLKASAPLFDAQLDFLNLLMQNETDEKNSYGIKDCFTGNTKAQPLSISVGGYTYKEQGKKCEITTPSGQLHQWTLEGGEWFERLIGYVLLKCGADDVRVRMRMQWRPETLDYLKNKIHQKDGENADPFKEDHDVVARFKGRYYLISCKAKGKKGTKPDFLTREAQAFAHTIDRFCIPMLCYLKYQSPIQPENVLNRNGVLVFGNSHFLSTEKMKELLEYAQTIKKTF